jgi:hypothetical protein
MVPGFGMNQKTRPLVIEKSRSFIEEKSVVIRSQRLLDELRVFIWKRRESATESKAQALQGYNDDLVMSWSIGLFLRDTAIRFRQTAMDLTYASLSNFHKTTQPATVYTPGQQNQTNNPWQIHTGNNQYDDITWVLG